MIIKYKDWVLLCLNFIGGAIQESPGHSKVY